MIRLMVLPRGVPLAPILANLFIGVHEKKRIQNYSLQGPLYYRYVDDIFAVFDNESDAVNFFLYLNRQHQNMKLTIRYLFLIF